MADQKFCIWEWEGQGKKHTIEVRISWGPKAKGKYQTYDITAEAHEPVFSIHCSDPPLDLEDGDIKRLSQRLKADLEAFHQIKWEPKLLVSFSAVTDERTVDHQQTVLKSTGFKLMVTEWEEGTRSSDGAVLYRQLDPKITKVRLADDDPPPEYTFTGSSMSYKKLRKGTLVDSNRNAFPYRDAIVGAVEDTPENRAALDAIQDRITQLGETLSAFLAEDQLQQTLTTGVGKLLPEAK